MFRFYHTPLSPFCRKVRLVLSEKKLEFLFSCLYSKDDINVSVSNQVGVKVRSLFSEITLKYGNVSELPRTLELLISIENLQIINFNLNEF